MTQRRVAVIGFGAVGAALVDALLARTDPAYEIAVLLRPGSPSRPRLPAGCKVVHEVGALRDVEPALVVEAAGGAAVREYGPACLGLGVPLLLSSVGALHDDALREALVAAAERAGTRLYLPSGALAGLDYVRAARAAERPRVRYESRKPPAAWQDELARRNFPATPDGPMTLYEGNARGAAACYPANLNVAATLAMAGIGLDRTEVAVVVDPAATGNTHLVSVESEYGTLDLTVKNRPAPGNPKTSWIVSRSLLAAIDQHFSPILML